jgi:PAS domain S-box-containing protein
MDAILLLDHSGAIMRTNSAALRVFGCSDEDLLGERFVDFLDAPSAKQFALFLNRVADPKSGDGALWVPQSLNASRWDRSSFPAEITLSRFEADNANCFTVILRNIDERIEAERRIRELTDEAEMLRAESGDAVGPAEMIGRSPCMRALFESIDRVAPSDSTALIHGETGTGKELVARAIHLRSKRSKHPLVKVNCAAIPSNLMESEFFGHEKGAFTGATSKRDGRFALADKGTLFLDEVGELPLDLQSKLLRVIQEGEFEPVGGNQTIHVDVRIVAATNRDLAAMVQEGGFREDLYYRLNVFPLQLPPLRERRGDIGMLAQAFVEKLARRMGRAMAALTDSDLQLLRTYDWPGNVRELQNVIERAIILARGPRPELARAMPQTTFSAAPNEENHGGGAERRILTASELRDLEADNLKRAMEAVSWKVSGAGGAAELLGLPPTTVNSRLKALGVKRPLS